MVDVKLNTSWDGNLGNRKVYFVGNTSAKGFLNGHLSKIGIKCCFKDNIPHNTMSLLIVSNKEIEKNEWKKSIKAVFAHKNNISIVSEKQVADMY